MNVDVVGVGLGKKREKEKKGDEKEFVGLLIMV